MDYLEKWIPAKVLILKVLPNSLIWYSPVLLLWDTVEIFTSEHKLEEILFQLRLFNYVEGSQSN